MDKSTNFLFRILEKATGHFSNDDSTEADVSTWQAGHILKGSVESKRILEKEACR